MFYPYSSGYHIPSSPSLPGAWSSAWSLPQQHLEYETVSEIKHGNHSSTDSLDCPEPTDTPIHKRISRSETDPPGALFASCQHEISYLSLSQSSLTSSQDDAISDSITLPQEYSPSYSQKLTPLASESNVSLDTLSLFSASNSPLNSPNSISSQHYSFSSEMADMTTRSLRNSTETPPNFDNDALGTHDTSLDQTEHIPKVSNTGRDHSSESYPYPLLLSQPDGNNTWTLSLDPTIFHSISGSSLESESSSASDYDDEAIARTRGIFPLVSSTSRDNGSFLSLPPSQVGADLAKFTASDVSMIVSSSSRETIPNRGKADRYSNDLPHDFPPSTAQDSVLDHRQPSRSKTLIKKSKNVFDRLKKLFTPKGTSDPPKSAPASGRLFPSYQRYKLTKPTQSSTPSFGHSFNFSPGDTSHADNIVDEKYTYEYHARPKTLKEIKSQRRFSLPVALVGTSSRVTPPKRTITMSFSQSKSRPMSMYNPPQNNFAASLRNQQ